MSGVRVIQPDPIDEPGRTPEIDTVTVTVDGETRERQRVTVTTEPGTHVDARLIHAGGAPVDSDNPVPVQITDATLNVDATFTSRISTLNSSFTPLGANETFVGTWEDCLNYAALTFTINTDANSAQDGAVVQWSDDGVNVLSLQTATVQPLPTGIFFALAPQGKFFRVIYTNGPVAQTFLRSEVSMLFSAPALTQGPIANPSTDLNIGVTTVGHMKGRVMDGPYAGVWQAIGTDGLGKLFTVDAQAAADAAAALVRHEQAVVELQAVNTELDGIRTEQFRRTDPLPAGGNTIGVVGVNSIPPVRDEIGFYASAAGGHQAFNITTGLVSITSSGLQPLALLANPSGSGLDIWLDMGEFGSSANTTFQRQRVVSFTTSGSGVSPGNMAGVTANTSPLRFYLPGNFTVSSPVTVKTAHIAAFSQYLTSLKGKVRIRPGQALYWVIQGPGGLGGSLTASIFFEYWQAPAT